MKELAEVIIKLFEELPFIKRDNLSDGGNIFFGDELYQNQNTLSIAVSSISDVILQNGDYEDKKEITLTITWYGELNYMTTYLKAFEIYHLILSKKWSRTIDPRIFYIEPTIPEYSDKVEDRYVFSFDLTIGWEGEF